MTTVSRFGLTWEYGETGEVFVYNGMKLIYRYATDGVSDNTFFNSINNTHNWILRNMK